MLKYYIISFALLSLVFVGCGSKSPEPLDEEILDFIAREGESAYHLSGTCKMGTDDMSVVDADLRVHGVENLRVVDASIMPTVTNGNIYSPVLMIGEKAADAILGNTPLELEAVEYYKHK